MGETAFLSTQILDASASGVTVLTGTAAQGRTALELGTMAQAATSSYLAIAGGTLTGKLNLATAGTALSGTAALNLPQNVGSVTALVDGDVFWGSGAAVFVRMGGVSYSLAWLNQNNTFANLCTFNAGIVGSGADLNIRSSTTPQAISVYNTYTSATNNEHIHIGAESTYYVIASVIGSSGGTARPINIGHINSGGTLTTALAVGIDGKTCITVHDQIGLSYSPAGAATATLLLAAAGSNVHTVNRPTSGNITIAFSGDTNAQRWLVLLPTSGSGTPGTVTWPAGITWLTNAGSAPTLATGNSKTDSIVFQRSGSSTYFAWHTGVNA